jgi:predicted RNA-binding protein with RPS1 domain
MCYRTISRTHNCKRYIERSEFFNPISKKNMPNKENKTVIKRLGDKSKVYCQEDYAQEFYDRMFNEPMVRKDIKEGEIVRVVDFQIISRSNKEFAAVCANHLSLYFNFGKEKKYFEIYGFDYDALLEWIDSGKQIEFLQNNKVYIQIENVEVAKGSLYQAHLKTIMQEFREQIGKPTSAYTAKVVDKNQGGFIVEVHGVKAFLPGSLAAANKIIDFESYIGKTVYVMIEDYLKPSDIFVVSYKKYLDYILPGKLADLERNQLLTGTVTGTSKFGVFIEVDEIFTGLLHTTEMNPETLDKFNERRIKSGQEIQAWLKDIKDNKLILTENDPSQRINEYELFREKVEGNVKTATIVSIKAHGALIEIEKGVLGLLPVKEMKKYKRRLEVGEPLVVFIKKVDTSTGKIYLTMTDERVTSEV